MAKKVVYKDEDGKPFPKPTERDVNKVNGTTQLFALKTYLRKSQMNRGKTLSQ